MSLNVQPVSSLPIEPPRVGQEVDPSIHAQDENGETPLTRAARQGELARVEWLIHAKADPAGVDRNNNTPMWEAVTRSHFEIGKRLFDAGAPIPDPVWALSMLPGSTPFIQRILEWGANPNLPTPCNPLHLGIALNRRDLVQLLLHHKADVHCVVDHSTPLLRAYMSNAPSLELCRALEEADDGLTNHLITARLAGHRFSLAGGLHKGLPPRITFPAFAQTLSNHSWHAEITAASLCQAVNRTYQAKDYFANWKKGEIVTLDTGVVHHSIALVLFQKWLAIGNCGFGSEEGNCGLNLYEIRSNKWMKEVIETLLKLGKDIDLNPSLLNLPAGGFQALLASRERDIAFFQEGIQYLLELEPLHHIPLDTQLTGNCGYVAAKLSSLAILTFLHLNAERSMREAADLAYPIYDAVVLKDCERSIHELFRLERQEPRLQGIVSFDTLFSEIYSAWSLGFRDQRYDSEASRSSWSALRELYEEKFFQRESDRANQEEDEESIEDIFAHILFPEEAKVE